MPALEVMGLGLRRGGISSVEDVSFSLHRGQMTGLLGPQGSGKSTVLSIVSGIIPPSSGCVVGQFPLGVEPSRPGNQVGAVMGPRSTHPRRTVLDHLKWIARLVGADSAECHPWLREFGLADKTRTPAGELSGAELMRLAMAVALLGEPSVLVLDEPFPHLDPESTRWLEEFLRDCCRHGLSVLVSSQLLKEIDSLVDEIVVMGGGRVVAAGTSAQIVDRFSWEWIALDVENPEALAPELVRHGALMLDAAGETRLRFSGLGEDRVRTLVSAQGMSVESLRIVRDVNEEYLTLTDAGVHSDDLSQEEE